jgi:hypothetical protein
MGRRGTSNANGLEIFLEESQINRLKMSRVESNFKILRLAHLSVEFGFELTFEMCDQIIMSCVNYV